MHLLHRLALVGVLAAAAAPSARAAGDAVLVTGPRVLADGQPHTVQVASAALTPDARVKLEVAGEKRDDFDLSAPGLLSFDLSVPPGTAGPVSVVVKGRGPAGKVDATLEVPVVAASNAPLELSFEPALFTWGTDEAVKVTIRPPAGAQDLAARSFAVHSSAGVIDTLTPVGDGSYVARWTPPKRLPGGSQVVLFMVGEDNRPGQVFGAAALPVMATQTVRLEAPSGTTNLLETAGRTYGPFKADADGTVAFEAAIDPRAPTGTLTVAQDGGKQTRAVDLPTADGLRLTFNPPPEGLPADPDQRVEVALFGLTAGGRALEDAPVVTVDRGSITGVRKSRPRGAWVATFQPPPNPGAVTFTARAGEVEVTRTTTLVAAPPPPDAALVSDPERIGPAEKTLQVRATLKTDAGQAVVGRPPTLQVASGSLSGKLADGGDGTYTGTVAVDFAPVTVAVAPPLSPTGLPAAHLLAWTTPTRTAGEAPAVLMVGVTDVFGHGVAGAPVQLVGEGVRVVPSGKTGPTGLLALPVQREGDGPGVVRVTAAGLSHSVVLLPDGAEAAPVALGPEAHRDRVAAWQARTAAVVVPRLRAPVAVAAPAPVAGAPADGAPPAGGEGAALPTAPADGAADGATTAGPAPAPAASAGGVRARVSGALSTGGHVYASESEADPAVPDAASFDTGGLMSVPGAQVRATVWFGDTWGADVRGRAWTERIDLRGSEERSGSIDFHAGVRYAYPVTDWFTPYGVGGVHSVTAPLFSYADLGRTSLAVTRDRKTGVRLGVGGIVDVAGVFVRAEFGETFAAAPSVHQLDAEVAYAILDPLAVRLGFQLEGWRLRDLDANGVDTDVTGTLTTLTAGVTWLVGD